MDLNRFTILMGAMGVGLGFGLQTVVANFVSGLILLFERPLSVGDKVSVGDVSGVVMDIGIRGTQTHTWEGADVTVPNSNLVSGEFTNWSLADEHRRTDVNVGVRRQLNRLRPALLEPRRRLGRREQRHPHDGVPPSRR